MPSILGKGLEQGMVRNFYQLRMGKYAGALISAAGVSGNRSSGCS